MNIKEYKLAAFTKKYGYKSFSPNPIDKEWGINRPGINTHLEEANLRLGELNAFSTLVPYVDVFIRMHIVKEATQSSRIEGTWTRMDEDVLKAKDISPELKDDCGEVQNYIEAMNHSIKNLEKRFLPFRLIKEANKILLKGLRSKNKLPCKFRTSQNWVSGATIADGVFVPPHHTLVPDCINDLGKFLNNEEIQAPHLIWIGATHYQFEAIHLYLGGYGRIGRLLITRYLITQKVSNKSILYLSDFIEKNRHHYYDNLMAVSINSKREQWLNLFLVGIMESAKNAIDTFTKIISLRDKLGKDTIVSLGKRLPNAKALFTYLYSKPVVTVSDVMTNLDVTKQTANELIKDFHNLGILKEQLGYKLNRIFVFEEYLRLFER